jgi:peptide/nickel transport system permease protein
MAQETAGTIAAMPSVRRSGALQAFFRIVRQKPLGAMGGAIIFTVLIAAIFAEVIAPYGYKEVHFADTLISPNAKYLLGTDNLGRDQLSRIIYGARVSIFIAFGAVGLGITYAVVVGLASAWFGGAVDLLLSRIVDAFMAIPGLVFLLVISTILGPGILNVILVLSLAGIRESRVVRGAALSAKQNIYVEAARVTGAGPWRVITRHLLPNVMAPIIILATLRFGTVILIEAALSFLGYGVPPPFPSWGRMLGQEYLSYLVPAPWLGIAPGVALTVTVWGFNTLGDAIRDLLDPRLRGAGAGRFR